MLLIWELASIAGGRLQFDKPIVEPPGSIEQVDFPPPEVGETLDKALRDSDEASSVSYANFAVGFPRDSRQKLADYQQQILDYRS